MKNNTSSVNISFQRSTQKSIISPICINTYHKQGQLAKKNHSHLNVTSSPRSPDSARNSKTKLKLVSPFRKSGNISPRVKQNTPVLLQESTHSHKPYLVLKDSSQIQLGGKCSPKTKYDLSIRQVNKNSNVSISYHIQKQPTLQKTKSPLRNINFQKQHPNPHPKSIFQTAIQPQRAISPQRVCINNKSFDIGNLKSQIIYVSPINKQTFSEPSKQAQSVYFSSRKPTQNLPISISQKNNFPSQLVIQQENNIQELKESYESEIKDIKLLQQEIEQNTLEIKELLNSSRVSRQISSSKLMGKEQLVTFNEPIETQVKRSQKLEYQQNIKQVKNAICSQQTLINQLSNINTSKRINRDHKSQRKPTHDEVSVQTQNDNSSYISDSILNRSESRQTKLSITRNEECQIQMQIAPIEKEHSIIYHENNKIQLQHQYVLFPECGNIQAQTSPIQQIQKVQLQQLPVQLPKVQTSIQHFEVEIIPISQEIIEPEQTQSEINSINPNMKKVKVEIQSVDNTQTVIDYVQEMAQEVTHSIKVEQNPCSSTKIAAQQLKQSAKIPESQKSIISEGKSQASTKRRTKNNIYL